MILGFGQQPWTFGLPPRKPFVKKNQFYKLALSRKSRIGDGKNLPSYVTEKKQKENKRMSEYSYLLLGLNIGMVLMILFMTYA